MSEKRVMTYCHFALTSDAKDVDVLLVFELVKIWPVHCCYIFLHIENDKKPLGSVTDLIFAFRTNGSCMSACYLQSYQEFGLVEFAAERHSQICCVVIRQRQRVAVAVERRVRAVSLHPGVESGVRDPTRFRSHHHAIIDRIVA